MTSSGDARRAELAILQKADEDFAGLWEIPPVLLSFAKDPFALAKSTVGELHLAGLVQLVWGDPDPDEGSPVSAGDAEYVLADSANWDGDRPYIGRQVWLFTTAAGQRHLATSA